MKLLIQLGENKTSTAIVELSLKHVLLNTGQDNGYWPGPYPGSSESDSRYISHGLTKANPTRLHTSYPPPVGVSVYLVILPAVNLLPTCDQEHSVQLRHTWLVILNQRISTCTS